MWQLVKSIQHEPDLNTVLITGKITGLCVRAQDNNIVIWNIGWDSIWYVCCVKQRMTYTISIQHKHSLDYIFKVVKKDLYSATPHLQHAYLQWSVGTQRGEAMMSLRKQVFGNDITSFWAWMNFTVMHKIEALCVYFKRKMMAGLPFTWPWRPSMEEGLNRLLPRARS